MLNTLRARPPEIQDSEPLQRLRFGPACFAFDPVTGLTYTFSDSAASMIAWLQDGLESSQILARMRRKFGITEQRAALDLARLKMDLKQLELLVNL